LSARSATAAEALDALARIEADIVLLDYDLGDETALPLLSEIRRRWSALRILMVTAGLSDENTLHVMEAGFRSLSQGTTVRPPRLSDSQVDHGEVCSMTAPFVLLAGKRNRTEMLGRAQPLTARQSEVLRGILDGLANKEIAWKLKTSETSIKAVIQELFRRQGVATRSSWSESQLKSTPRTG